MEMNGCGRSSWERYSVGGLLAGILPFTAAGVGRCETGEVASNTALSGDGRRLRQRTLAKGVEE